MNTFVTSPSFLLVYFTLGSAVRMACAPPGPHPEDFDSSCQFCHQNTEDALEEEALILGLALVWIVMAVIKTLLPKRRLTCRAPRWSPPATDTRHRTNERSIPITFRFVNPGDWQRLESRCVIANPQSIVMTGAIKVSSTRLNVQSCLLLRAITIS